MEFVKILSKSKMIEFNKVFNLKHFNQKERLESLAIILFMFAMSTALNLVISGILFKVLDYSTLNIYFVYLIQVVISLIVFITGYSGQCVKIAKMI